MRIVTLFLVGCLVALSLVMYDVKYDTREMEEKVASLRLGIRKERDSIAILRAEWSHLNSPERIERLARKHLGMAPVQGRQMMTFEQLAATRGMTPGAGSGGPLAGEMGSSLRHRVKAVR
jgi:cell division protein FtsL